MSYAWRMRARKDANHAEIVAAFERCGASVLAISAPNAPDLVVGLRRPDGERVNLLVEVKRTAGKRGGTSRNGQKLSDGQAKWHREWRGDGVWIVRTPLEAAALCGYDPKEEP